MMKLLRIMKVIILSKNTKESEHAHANVLKVYQVLIQLRFVSAVKITARHALVVQIAKNVRVTFST